MIPLVIVGLGRIGAGNIGLAGALPASHLAAARAVGAFALRGLVDPNEETRQTLKERFPDIAPDIVVPDLGALAAPERPVIALATPPEGRLHLVERALAMRPRLLIVEKPLARDLDTAAEIASRCAEAGVQLRVNFHRRFDRRHLLWRDRAPRTPRLIAMRYGKGLHNYASHMIDMLLHWYGPVVSVQAFGDAAPGTKPGMDPTINFQCRLAAGFDAVCLGLDGLDYDQFEIDIFGAGERLEIADGGAEFRRYVPKDGKHYAGYTQLAPEGAVDRAPVGGFAELYEAVRDYISDGAAMPGCTGMDAVANAAILDAALRSHTAGGRPEKPRIPPALERSSIPDQNHTLAMASRR